MIDFPFMAQYVYQDKKGENISKKTIPDDFQAELNAVYSP